MVTYGKLVSSRDLKIVSLPKASHLSCFWVPCNPEASPGAHQVGQRPQMVVVGNGYEGNPSQELRQLKSPCPLRRKTNVGIVY
jgi:hypothetical protein